MEKILWMFECVKSLWSFVPEILTEWCSKDMVDCNQIKTWKYSTLYYAGDNQQPQISKSNVQKSFTLALLC